MSCQDEVMICGQDLGLGWTWLPLSLLAGLVQLFPRTPSGLQPGPRTRTTSLLSGVRKAAGGAGPAQGLACQDKADVLGRQAGMVKQK